jgi:cytochrome c-type biogenesis protein CcmF
MTAILGAILVFLSFLCAVYAALASIWGVRNDRPEFVESARNAAILTLPLLSGASLILIGLLLAGAFQVEYVWSVSSLSMPDYLKVTALWGGQAGSLLFWAWLMSVFSAVSMLRNWERERALMPYVISATMGTLAFFIALVVFWENPFTRLWTLPNGEVTSAIFGPSAILSSLTAGYFNLAARVPGLLGSLFQDVAPLAAPPGAVPTPVLDGQGLNPLLRHLGMVIHPPMLYLGFVGFVVPYAFAMAALATGQVSDSWIRVTRRWTLVGWLFLSLGLILGGRWAYDVLGWGGYWGWDPVENAALMPWFAGTAFLHSVMIQEKRGMLRRWNMVLIILTYLQVIWGTFLTRSGLISSVHSFAQSAIGPLFLLFLFAAVIISVRMLMLRWDELRSDNQLDDLLSREAAFLLNNLLFLIIDFEVFIGTHFTIFSELLTGEKVTVGPQWYNFVTMPFFLALVMLMGIAPLIAWKRTSAERLGRSLVYPAILTLVFVGVMFAFGFLTTGSALALVIIGLSLSITLLEFHRGAAARTRSRGESYPVALWTLFGRNRRRYGGYVIHLGVVVMAIGVVGSNAFQQETQQTVAAGQTITVGNYVMRYDELERFQAIDNRTVTRANVTVFKNGREVSQLHPRHDFYDSGQPATIPGNLSQVDEDFYVLLVAWEEISLTSATFKIYINPLINWVWAGGLIFIIGTFVAAWPDFSEERQRATQAAAVPAAQRA